MTVASNDREPVAWAWPAVFALLTLLPVGGVAFAVAWAWSQYAG
ncbi:hypothetical protein [Paractinoplanes aksuensis]|nr:hypothetical protein [Actinoplanes aksuensis]